MEHLKVNTIGVLTSGGDSPGMNAAVRAVVRTALGENMRVYGIRFGYAGLLENDMVEMNMKSVSDCLQRGGTILYTARSKEFAAPEGVEKAARILRQAEIDGLVVIGGDGSFRGARDLTAAGIPCIGIPGTIDNDIACSDYTIGFDTAVNTVIESVDKLRDTSKSHHRCSVVEVMGRNAGYIAIHAGIACGAIAALVPEVPFDIDRDVCDRIKKTLHLGRSHFIVMVSEGVGNTEEIARYIKAQTGVDTRATILGHVPRGGSPTGRDRIIASRMGYYAVKLLRSGFGGRVVAIREDNIVDYDIDEALSFHKDMDRELYHLVGTISI